MPEEKIVWQKIREGDPDEFKRLHDRYYALIIFVSMKADLSLEEAKDVAQETLFSIYKTRERHQGIENDRAYILGIAYHHLAMFIRKRKKAAALPDAQIADGSAAEPEKAAIFAEVIRIVEKMLKNANELDKQVIHLRYFEELRLSEIAQQLNVPVKAVKTRLFRARRRLRNGIVTFCLKREARIRKASETLKDFDLLNDHFLKGLSPEQIAENRGLSPEVVEVRIETELRELLNNWI